MTGQDQGQEGSEPPARVRVTGPSRRPPGERPPPTAEIDEDTPVGALLLGSLLREQLRLALTVLVVLVATVGALPLVFHLAPEAASVRLLGIPLSWLLLGVAVYPFLGLLGWLYVRRAEQNEDAFVELIAEVDSGGDAADARDERR